MAWAPLHDPDHRPATHPGAPSDALDRHVWQAGEPIPADALWFDLVEPTRDEDIVVERHLALTLMVSAAVLPFLFSRRVRWL